MKLCSQSEGTLPSRMIATARSRIMEAPMSPAAHLHHYAWWSRCFASLHLRDSLLNHINGDWDGRAFHWWLIWQVVWVPVKLNVEKPLVVLQPGLLLWVFTHWHLSCIILHRFVTNNISVLSSKLVSKAVDFQYSRRPSCRLLDKHGALHVWHFVWLHRMMPYCLYQPSRPWKLSTWQQWPFPRVRSTTNLFMWVCR